MFSLFFICSNIFNIEIKDFFRFSKSLGDVLFKAILFRILFIFETDHNSSLTLSSKGLFLRNSSIKSCLFLISFILFNGFKIELYRKWLPEDVFVLSKTQNKVAIFADLVAKL